MTREAEDPILAAFAGLVKAEPGAAAVVSGTTRASRDEVAALARAAGRALAAAAPPEGAPIALAAPNGPGFLAAFLALRRAGHPVVMLDHAAPAGERLRTAAAMGAPGVLTASAWPRGTGDFAVAPVAGAAKLRLAPGIGVVKLTSGSTGQPRGILTPSAALVADDRALAATMRLGDAGERILAAIPFSHSYGLSSVVLPVLARGSLAVVPGDGGPFASARAAAAARVTFLPTVPAYLAALVEMADPPPIPDSVRLVTSAGAPLAPAVAARFRARFGRPVQVFYGASECGGICFDREGGAAERGTVGSPVEGVSVELAGQAEDGAGVVTVRSPAVARGYHPAPDRRLDGDRFETGDRGRFRDGELQLLGRLDDLINVKGKKVDPREVEAVVAELPGVAEAVVLGVPLADGVGQAVRAVVACKAGVLTAESVRDWCAERLAPHKVPRSLVLVRELPRGSRGKLDRRALATLAEEA